MHWAIRYSWYNQQMATYLWKYITDMVYLLHVSATHVSGRYITKDGYIKIYPSLVTHLPEDGHMSSRNI
jgi:hypothetical protein